MKSFDDFLAQISAKDQEEISNMALSSISSSGVTFSEEDLKLASLIAQGNALFTRELLHRYHDWLSEQIQ